MNKHNYRNTWVDFELVSPIPVRELAFSVEALVIASGFIRVEHSGGIQAISALAEHRGSISGKKIAEVLPLDKTLLMSTSAWFYSRDHDVSLTFQIGRGDDEIFNSESLWNHFRLIANAGLQAVCLNLLFEQLSRVEQSAVIERATFVYRFTKKLFSALVVERCVGVDEKSFTGDAFNDSPAFFFSRTEPWILNEILETPIDPTN